MVKWLKPGRQSK